MKDNPESKRGYVVRAMSPDELTLTIQWAEQEGWNPGRHDARCFHAADPHGFFIGELHGEPIGSISAVAYDTHFGFIGLYIVRPDLRGQGLGIQLWRHAMAYLGERNVGLDGVVAQQANYAESGFQPAHRNIRFQGIAHGVKSDALSNLSDLPFDQLTRYDRQIFTAPRPAFLKEWIAQPGVIALAAMREGRMRGYGVVRRCHQGRKIGPLFADDEHIAEELFDALLDQCAGEMVSVDVPQNNAAAVTLAERHGMTSSFETARMYTKQAPPIPIAKVFGITSFELG
jgi:GNAT superfamily N-acetyltransferase